MIDHRGSKIALRCPFSLRKLLKKVTGPVTPQVPLGAKWVVACKDCTKKSRHLRGQVGAMGPVQPSCIASTPLVSWSRPPRSAGTP